MLDDDSTDDCDSFPKDRRFFRSSRESPELIDEVLTHFSSSDELEVFSSDTFASLLMSTLY